MPCRTGASAEQRGHEVPSTYCQIRAHTFKARPASRPAPTTAPAVPPIHTGLAFEIRDIRCALIPTRRCCRTFSAARRERVRPLIVPRLPERQRGASRRGGRDVVVPAVARKRPPLMV